VRHARAGPGRLPHRRHLLQVDCDDLDLGLPSCVGGAAAREDLRPRPGRRAQVHCARDAREEVELVVELKQLERRARPPALFLGLAVVDVALVLGVLACRAARQRLKARGQQLKARVAGCGGVAGGVTLARCAYP